MEEWASWLLLAALVLIGGFLASWFLATYYRLSRMFGAGAIVVALQTVAPYSIKHALTVMFANWLAKFLPADLAPPPPPSSDAGPVVSLVVFFGLLAASLIRAEQENLREGASPGVLSRFASSRLVAAFLARVETIVAPKPIPAPGEPSSERTPAEQPPPEPKQSQTNQNQKNTNQKKKKKPGRRGR